MKMGSKLKLARNGNQSRRLRLVMLLVGCFLVTMTYLVASKPRGLVRSSFGFRTSMPTPLSGDDVLNGDENGRHSTASGRKDPQNSQASAESNDEKEKSIQGEKNAIVVDSTSQEVARTDELTEGGEQIQTLERKSSCDLSDERVDICELYGDIRIPGNSSSVLFMESSNNTEHKEAWRVHPYPRKGDETCLREVRELTIRATSEAPRCTVHHNVSAIVFSVSGYTGNLFHDFSDLLIPLFVTARQFDGEVQFVVTDFRRWWINKYRLVLQRLSKYPVMDFDGDEEVHCFKQVIVGLRAHQEFQIDPARAPNGYTLIDFTRFIRSTYSLQRETVNNIEDLAARKPRLLIIARKKTRAFTNVGEIVAMAEGLGFEVVVDEANVSSDMAQFARTVNSCDVMMGVHGAGLTNFVFLPLNATMIQIVPWGGLEWMSMLDFGYPAMAMGLKYLQHSITIEESTLTEQYPRDHRVFTDPMSFHGSEFKVVRSTFMKTQNVKLDVNRFKGVLWEALEKMIQ
ncbi:unnamed protein product [Musa acuminata subsp. malaccensis]|uniref:(wild Malaysian banana) hypothetical protein n=1 Tax=Musa acuminata subsp. malaccensis TaxID=214687 RepID=A0A804I3G0_MUSAM|nr:PREDICTED: uncharacterized protein LOC103975541 isoform X1 [Musa acuminata subsp. malaccensis]CAG1862221.1 unnamed protein product [Musa acuminata subsp. malaccensis]